MVAAASGEPGRDNFVVKERCIRYTPRSAGAAAWVSELAEGVRNARAAGAATHTVMVEAVVAADYLVTEENRRAGELAMAMSANVQYTHSPADTAEQKEQNWRAEPLGCTYARVLGQDLGAQMQGAAGIL